MNIRNRRWLNMKISQKLASGTLCSIPCTLTAIVLLHYGVAVKMTLEIFGYSVYRTPCAGFDYNG